MAMKKFPGAVFAVACALCSLAYAQQSSCTGQTAVDLQFATRPFPVERIGQAVLFHAGMTVDADGAPNAYGPRNQGLDFVANARSGGRFTSVALRSDGQPVIQRSGRFKGFYVSTTSLRSASGSPSSPGTYVDA